jgi:hypothetical protein
MRLHRRGGDEAGLLPGGPDTDDPHGLRGQVEVYSIRAFVRSQRRIDGRSWVSWNDRFGGGPMLIVRQSSVEVSAPKGWILESRCYVFRGSQAAMSRDRIGWGGTPLFKKDCIRLALDSNARLAVTPHGDIDEAWTQLATAGVRTTDEA